MSDVFRDKKTTAGGAAPWASNPPFDRRHLRVIELALRAAWGSLLNDAKHAAALSALPEPEITLLLRDALNKLRESPKPAVKGYDCNIFELPHVSAEMRAPSGEIRKPDIVFRLSGNPRPGVEDGTTDGIFVECKILEQGTKKNVGEYCNNGMHKFVDGSYAAWMREGMMLAYVRSDWCLPPDLQKELNDDGMRKMLATDGALTQCTLTQIEPRVYISVHARHWSYPEEKGGGAPGPIALRHLWLGLHSRRER